jgi:hypothetical protein
MTAIISLFPALLYAVACYRLRMPVPGPLRAFRRLETSSHSTPTLPLPPKRLRFLGRTPGASHSIRGSGLDDNSDSSSSGLSLLDASSGSLSSEQLKRHALDLLDVLTSTDDPDNAEFDEDKLARKEQLLICNSYQVCS